MSESWQTLFDRADEYECSFESLRTAVAAQREADEQAGGTTDA